MANFLASFIGRSGQVQKTPNTAATSTGQMMVWDNTGTTWNPSNSVVITSGTGRFSYDSLATYDSDASHYLTFRVGSNLTANRILTITTGDANRTLTLNGDTVLNGTNTGDQTISLTGDVTGSGTGSFAATIAANVVTMAKIQTVATASILGRVTASTGNVEVLTGTQTTTLLDVFTSALKGLAPASGGGTTNFLRADGTWAAPASSGITTLNTLTASTQTFATGTTGADFNIASSTSTHTFHIPDAGASARGLVTTGAQTLAGVKTFTSAPVVTLGTITANAPVSVTETWNSAGVTFTGLSVAVTDTTSAAASNLFDFSIGGTSALCLKKQGRLLMNGATSTSYAAVIRPASSDGFVQFVDSSGTERGVISYGDLIIQSTGTNNLSLRGSTTAGYGVICSFMNSAGFVDHRDSSGNIYTRTNLNGFTVGMNAPIIFGATVGAPDLYLYRGAANTLDQRNSTNGQTNNIYGTYTDGSNYRRIRLAMSSGTATIIAEGAGTGASSNNLNVTGATVTVNTTAGKCLLALATGAIEYGTNTDSSSIPTSYLTAGTNPSTVSAGGGGFVFLSGFESETGTRYHHTFRTQTLDAASGTHNIFTVSPDWQPASGTGVCNFLNIEGSFDSASSGVTRALYINPSVGAAGGGYRALEVASGISIFAATATSAASIRMPHGTAPTSPVDGDWWTTTSGAYVRINGATVGPLGAGGGGGITTLNTLTAGTQTFATGTTGSDFNIASSTSTHTFHIPDAGASARGLVTTGAQTLAGAKTLTGAFTNALGTITANTPLTTTQTWNNAGVVFDALDLNITDTTSSSNSTLIRGRVGGTTVFSARKDGQLNINGAIAVSGGTVGAAANAWWSSNSLNLPNASSFGWNADAYMYRDGANAISVRNSTNAQTFRVYGTYTDLSNNRRVDISVTTGGLATVNAKGIGTGVSGNTLELRTEDVYRMKLPGGSTGTGTIDCNAANLQLTNNSGVIGIGSSTFDVGITRTAAAILRICGTAAANAAALNLIEMTGPAAPAANGVYIYAADDGGGNTNLEMRFASGAVDIISSQDVNKRKQKVITSGTAAPSGGVDGDIYLQYV